MSTTLRDAKTVAEQFGCSEWTILELVRRKKVACVRIGAGDDKSRAPVRFTDEQVAQIVASLTVETPDEVAPRRRKRRSA